MKDARWLEDVCTQAIQRLETIDDWRTQEDVRYQYSSQFGAQRDPSKEEAEELDLIVA